jgi:uncharacterized membrane protein
MSVILFVVVMIGGVLVLDARSRLNRLEKRQQELEGMLRLRPVAAPLDVPEAILSPSVQTEPPAPIVAKPSEVIISRAAEPSAAPYQPEPEPAPTRAVPSEPEQPKARVFTLDFEELFGRRLPIWAGGITLAIAGVLIVKYAIDIGLFGRVFTPPVQIFCGMIFGAGLIGGAEIAHRQRLRVDDPRVGQALSGAGISTLYAAILVAVNAYELILPLTAFFGLALVTVAALGLSLRHGPPSALLGLIGGLAAPALTMAAPANVPLLSTYLALTIAALVGVSRSQRWFWLAPLALIGGAGWSLWLILAGQAFGLVSTLSLGGLVLLLAIAAPLVAFKGPRSALMQTAAALVGAAQLALLLAIGGFDPLHWALFTLIMAAGQWVAWRNSELAIVPTIGLGLSTLLLLIWPAPEPTRLAIVALGLAAIHALPLIARLWHGPARVQRAVEICAIAVAVPLVTLRHFGEALGEPDALAALASVGGAVLALFAAALGWKSHERRDDSRFAWLIATAAGLLIAAAWLAVPHWQACLVASVVAVAVLLITPASRDSRLELIAANCALAAFVLLAVTIPFRFTEIEALVDGRAAGTDFPSLLRWSGLAAMAAIFSWRGTIPVVRDSGAAAAASLSYGALAQLLPGTTLPLSAPAGVLALTLWSRIAPLPRVRPAMLALAGIAALWAFMPMLVWINGAAWSLVGEPMGINDANLAPSAVLRRLFVPAMLLATSLWLLRERLGRQAALIGTIATAVIGLVAVHCLYRAGFAELFGSNFVQTGLAQRLVWTASLIVAGYALWKRAGQTLGNYVAPALVGAAALHTTWYSLILHNPLWTVQAVGPVPLANLLVPLFAALPIGIWLLGKLVPAIERHAQKALQPALIVMIALFAWATLRQAFHGSLLTMPGLGQTEDILRSILGIALALGYLLWGIRTSRRDWRIASLVLMLAAVVKVFLFDASGLEGLLRIASFIALGFSLIGIGWLYSRQLRREAH